jgi:transketolase
MTWQLDPGSWQYRGLNARAPSLSTMADALNELVEEGHPIVALTADLQYSNGLVGFAKRHPERLIQFGISEQNMVTAAAGIATTGLIPFAATFASYLALLCNEQIRTDIAYSALPVRLVGHHAGIALGFYGTSHHATEDIAAMRAVADLTVVAPADGAQFAAAIKASVNWPEPIYFRIARGHDPVVYNKPAPFAFGKAIVHEEGRDLTIIASGTMVHPALIAVRKLRQEGHDVGFIDMHTIKPLDREAIIQAAGNSGRFMTVEEHNVLGGLGGAVAEVLADIGGAPPLRRHGIMDEYSLIAPPTHLYAHYRLDDKGIESVAREVLAGG